MKATQMRKYKKSQLPYRPGFRFDKTNRDRQFPELPVHKPRKIKRTLIVLGSLAAVNVAVALFNPWLGIFASFLLGPAYIIKGIVLAVDAFTENSEAEPDAEAEKKRKKTRLRVALVAPVLIIAVIVFLLLLSGAVSNIDFR